MPPSLLRPFPFPLLVASAVGLAGLGLVNGPVRAQAAAPAVAPASQASSAMVVARTKAAAERILVTLRNGDAISRYRQFAPSLQRMTSPAMIRQRMSTMPKLLSWTLGPVVPGQDSSTITTRLVTSAGPRELQMELSLIHISEPTRPY